jgi:hypothetical protein
LGNTLGKISKKIAAAISPAPIYSASLLPGLRAVSLERKPKINKEIKNETTM